MKNLTKKELATLKAVLKSVQKADSQLSKLLKNCKDLRYSLNTDQITHSLYRAESCLLSDIQAYEEGRQI